MLKNLKLDQLKKELAKYRFDEVYTIEDVFNMILSVDEGYKSYSMISQSKRVYFLPYLVIFYTFDALVLNAFYKFFNMLKTAIFGTYKHTKDVFAPRIVIHNNMIIVDVTPTNKLRASYHLYVIRKNCIIIDSKSVEELDDWQEVEIVTSKINEFTLR